MLSNKLYAFFIVLLLIVCFQYINVKANSIELLGKIIYIDPGHGGLDPGSVYKNIYEKDINLSICLKLKEKFEKEGAIVYLTRYGDYDLGANNALSRKKSDLNNRVKLINSSNADMYISIHLNSIKSSTWSGAQVFYDDVNERNYYLANLMQEELKKGLKTSREIKEISNMLMNRKITIPGILIEVGFLSNANDRYKLQKDDYQNKVVDTINKGVLKYFN